MAPQHAPLPPGAQRAVHRYLDCGIFESGFARVRCGECGHDFFVAFSCKLRCMCPSCHIKRELLWAQWAADELLEDVPHRQLVLTIPKRLRPYFRYDRALLGDLAGCAWRALRVWTLATLGDDTALPGAIGFIQTAGELLNFHPHLHLLITDGVLDPDGSFERLPYPDARQLERLFRAELLRLLLARGRITQEIVDNLLSWHHSGFSVHADVCVADRVVLAELAAIGERTGHTAAQVALNWVAFSRGDAVVGIPGATRVDQARDNARALRFRITDEDVERLDNVSSSFIGP